MPCPTCPVLLVSLNVGAIELDECPHCLGMWFDAGELQRFVGARLVAAAIDPAGTTEMDRPRSCPRCTLFIGKSGAPQRRPSNAGLPDSPRAWVLA